MKKQKIQIQPWHIALIVIAVLLVTWRMVAHVREQKRMTTGEFTPGQREVNPRTQPRFERLKERREKEK